MVTIAVEVARRLGRRLRLAIAVAAVATLLAGVDAQYRGYQHKFTKQANDLGCSVFFGRFDYMSDAYQLTDVVVLPSQSESFGYSALESLSLGIPTILNDIPTFHEIADGHPSARFFRGDSMELSNVNCRVWCCSYES